jgi:anti-sigma regulatory factor (Ser/Thr protein kinase)
VRWRRPQASAAGCDVAPTPVRRHLLTVPLEPASVRLARRDVAGMLTECGVDPGSVFVGAVLLVVSELIANAFRHAQHSPTADVAVTLGAGRLVVGVADRDPRLPDLSPTAVGDGLRTVAELAAAHGGGLSAEPAEDGRGKVMLVHFRLPTAGESATQGTESRHGR